MNTGNAIELKTLIMPGPVIEGHVEFETECSNCHVAFSRNLQRDLCMDCHDDVAADVTAGKGFHGRSDEARTQECASCHTEHEGRGIDIIGLDPERFDHGLSDFILLGAHLETDCEDCHLPTTKFREAPGLCIECHVDDDAHEGILGEDCQSCHQETDWQEIEFDHGRETDFPLLGRHADTTCETCHLDPVFEATLQTDCYSCHVDDDAHEGELGEDCGQCHNETAWTEGVAFEHDLTVFPLIGLHADAACADCHETSKFHQASTVCIDCHRDHDDHGGRLGPACGDCHNPNGWAFWTFDHDTQTDYALDGAHVNLQCVACHAIPVSGRIELGRQCIDCHRQEDVHRGQFGNDCERCHSTSSFSEVKRFR